MRKTASSSRIRKKASSPPPATRQIKDQDPFHNGQTPACGLLLHAIQDVFPELQQQMKHQTPSSDLGLLLRCQFLKKRKARKLPPVPPLDDGTPPANATGPSKKKNKKKKKKKKQDNSNKTETSKEDAYSVDNDTMDDNNTNSESKELDESIKEESQQAAADSAIADAPPSLDSLPSDDLNGDDAGNRRGSVTVEDKLQSSSAFLQHIPYHETPIPGKKMFSSADFFGKIESQLPEGTPDIPTIPPIPPIPPTPENTESPATPKQPPKTTTDSSVLNSPTHEWVPEEGATSLKETPPGDVIKDPLELPFLLRLNSLENSLTTTTIDGSLISAEAVNEEVSSLENTFALYEEWLEQLDHEQKYDHFKDYQSFLEFLQDRLRKGKKSLGIPLNDLKDSCAWIECANCRQEALAEVEKLQELPEEKPVVLNPYYLKDGNAGQEMTVETAFDYVALEEGNHQPTADVEEEEPDLDTCLSFVVSEPKQRKNASKQLFFDVLTQKHLDTLVEKWLPCGIEEDVMVTTAVTQGDDDESPISANDAAIVMSTEDFHNMQTNVLENESDIRVTLDELQKVAADLLNEMANFSASFDAAKPNLELRAFPMLKDVDKMCTGYVEKLLDVLKATTDEKSCHLADLQMHIWTSYLIALNKSLKATDTYYTKMMEELADQAGVFPKIFISAELRSLYQTLVEDKVRIWTDLGTVFSNNLTCRVLKEWFTRSAWQNGVDKKAQAQESKKLDEDCHALITELSNWTETLSGGRVAEIQRDRMSQTEYVLELLQSIVEPLTKEYATVERYFSKDCNMYFAGLRSNIVLAHGVKKQMRLIDQTEVECMSTGAILMWRQMRIMKSRMILSVKLPSLPLQLKRWMLQDESRFDEWRLGTTIPKATAWGHHHIYCRAVNGGKRRVMCVLAGLAYRWLGDRCMEWKAELAEKELLTDFDMAPSMASFTDQSSAQDNKASKTSKKNKKKKKKPASSLVDVSNNAKMDESKQHSQSKDSSVQINGIHDEAKIALATIGTANNALANETGDDNCTIATLNARKEAATNEDSPKEQTDVPASMSNAEIEKLGNSKDPEIAVGAEEESDVDNYASSVYVQDEKEIVSARDFLVGRLFELLQNDDKVFIIQ